MVLLRYGKRIQFEGTHLDIQLLSFFHCCSKYLNECITQSHILLSSVVDTTTKFHEVTTIRKRVKFSSLYFIT